MVVGPTRFDVALDALSHVYRRRLLVELAAAPCVSLADDASPVSNDLSMASDAVYQQLFHIHLPKLVEMGFVEWNRETDVVSGGERLSELVPLLELIDARVDELPEGWL